MKNKKQQESEANAAAVLIAGFIATNPKAYKMVDRTGVCSSKTVINQRDLWSFINQNLETKTQTSRSRIMDLIVNNFAKATGYGLNLFDSNLANGRFAQYDVTEVPLNIKIYNNEQEILDMVRTSYAWLSASEDTMSRIINQNYSVIHGFQTLYIIENIKTFLEQTK